MITEDCAGKTKVETDISNILELTREHRKDVEDTIAKLQNDLCCVTYPVKESYFDWKKCWFKKRVVNKKLHVYYCNYGYDTTCIKVKTELPFSWPSNEPEMFTIVVKTSTNNEGKLISKLRQWDYPNYIELTYAQFLGQITKRIAEYTIKEKGLK